MNRSTFPAGKRQPHRLITHFAWVVIPLWIGAVAFTAPPTPSVARTHPYDAPEVDAILALLHSRLPLDYGRELDDRYPGRDLVAMLKFHLRTDVGPAIRDEAMHRLAFGSPADREKAMLLLALFDDIPPDFLQRMRESTSLEQAIWGRYGTKRSTGPKNAPRPSPWLEDQIHRSWRPGPNPLLTCKEEILRRLRYSQDRLESWESSNEPDHEEALRGYYEIFLPNLQRIEEFAHTAQVAYVDMDGDGREELFLHIQIPDGWLDIPHFLAFQTRSDGTWEVTDAGQLEETKMSQSHPFRAADLNGDGLPEVFESLPARGRRYANVRVHSGTAPSRNFQGRHLDVITMPGKDQAMVVTGMERHLPSMHFAYDSLYKGYSYDREWRETVTECIGRSMWEE